MSSVESRPKPDHKIQLSDAAGVVQPAGSESKKGRVRQPHRRRNPY
jgi:hypothetical protein